MALCLRSVIIRLLRTVLRGLPGPIMHGPESVLEQCAHLITEEQETFTVLLLNNKMKVLGRVEPFRGTIHSCQAHAREIFRDAVRVGAWGVIVVHNHPSGDPTPSQEDRKIFRILEKAGHLLGIPVIDCIVIGGPDELWSKRYEEDIMKKKGAL